jgi:hypothetical protein
MALLSLPTLLVLITGEGAVAGVRSEPVLMDDLGRDHQVCDPLLCDIGGECGDEVGRQALAGASTPLVAVTCV